MCYGNVARQAARHWVVRPVQPPKPMQLRRLAFVFAALMAPLALSAAQQIHRCSSNGSVTYQADPCPSTERRPEPSVKQLNAERQRRLQQAASSPGAASVPAAEAPRPVAAWPARVATPVPSPVQPRAPQAAAFRCDGRQFCSQMTSCAEAHYFLAHCPDVHMDGNHDGVPCERQWCRPLH